MIRALTRLRRDRRGATILEFGLVIPVFALMCLGLFDLAHQRYVRSVLNGAVQKAGRDSGLQTGVTNAATIDAQVQGTVKRTVPNGTFSSTRLAYQDFANINQPEPFTDSNNNGTRDPGECFQDVNGNGSWNASAGASGQGGASDAVVYTVTVTYPHMFPVVNALGMSSTVTMAASTVLRNQPYATDSQPPIVCA